MGDDVVDGANDVDAELEQPIPAAAHGEALARQLASSKAGWPTPSDSLSPGIGTACA